MRIGRGNVGATIKQRRDQLIPGDRDDGDMNFEVPRIQILVERFFERLKRVVGDPALSGAVEKIPGHADGHDGPDNAALDHAIEVSCPFPGERKKLLRKSVPAGCKDERLRHVLSFCLRGRLRGRHGCVDGFCLSAGIAARLGAHTTGAQCEDD